MRHINDFTFKEYNQFRAHEIIHFLILDFGQKRFCFDKQTVESFCNICIFAGKFKCKINYSSGIMSEVSTIRTEAVVSFKLIYCLGKQYYSNKKYYSKQH